MEARGKDRLAMEGIQDIGQRIVQAARLAVAVHLYESANERTSSSKSDDALRVAGQILRRRIGNGTGGAGRIGIAAETSRLGDLVTDDERDGLMGRGDPGEP